MPTDRAILKDALTGLVGSTPMTDPAGEVKKLNRKTFTWNKAAIDTNATDNTAEFPFAKLEVAGRVVAASYTALANVASAANNTIQLTVLAHLAADAANGVVVANALTNATPLVSYTPYALTLVANAVDVTANSVLSFKILKANSGTALAGGVLSVTVEDI